MIKHRGLTQEFFPGSKRLTVHVSGKRALHCRVLAAVTSENTETNVRLGANEILVTGSSSTRVESLGVAFIRLHSDWDTQESHLLPRGRWHYWLSWVLIRAF